MIAHAVVRYFAILQFYLRLCNSVFLAQVYNLLICRVISAKFQFWKFYKNEEQSNGKVEEQS